MGRQLPGIDGNHSKDRTFLFFVTQCHKHVLSVIMTRLVAPGLGSEGLGMGTDQFSADDSPRGFHPLAAAGSIHRKLFTPVLAAGSIRRDMIFFQVYSRYPEHTAERLPKSSAPK